MDPTAQEQGARGISQHGAVQGISSLPLLGTAWEADFPPEVNGVALNTSSWCQPAVWSAR